MDLRFTAPELAAYAARVFPELAPRFEIVAMAPFRLTVRMATGPADLRPGGTVSGPTIFACADCAFYMATLAMIGPDRVSMRLRMLGFATAAAHVVTKMKPATAQRSTRSLSVSAT